MKEKSINFYDIVLLDEDAKTSVIEVLRTGEWNGSKGKFSITEETLDNFVASFKEKMYGTDLQVNVAHNREGEAAGWFRDVYRKGQKLLAKIEWTEHGLKLLKDKIFRYISAELAFKFKNEETGQEFEDVLLGAALTNVPYIRGLSPVQLSEQINIHLFSNSQNMETFKIFLSELMAKAIVSPAEKATMKKMLVKLSEEDQKAVEGDVGKVEEKPEEKPVEPPKEEKPAGEAEGGSEEKKELSEKTEPSVLLAEIKRLSEENKTTRQMADQTAAKLRLAEITEESKSLMLSESNTTGLPKGMNEKVIKFMEKLSDALRKDFKEILKSVQTVDFQKYSSGEAVEASESIDFVKLAEDEEAQDKVAKLAEKYLREGKAKDIREAQKMATEDMMKKMKKEDM